MSNNPNEEKTFSRKSATDEVSDRIVQVSDINDGVSFEEVDYEMVAVVAEDSSRTIAVEGQGIPWHYPEDKKQYENLVTGQHQVFGRKTYEQVPSPTAQSVVLTRDESYTVPEENISVANSKAEAEEIMSTFDGPVYNLGGADIYELFFDECQKLIVSHIPEVADTEQNVVRKFPRIMRDQWEIEEVKEFKTFERVTYIRKNNPVLTLD